MSKDPKGEGGGLFGRLKSFLSREHAKSPATDPGQPGVGVEAHTPPAHGKPGDTVSSVGSLDLGDDIQFFRAAKLQEKKLPPTSDGATLPARGETDTGTVDEFGFFKSTTVKKTASPPVLPPVPPPPPVASAQAADKSSSEFKLESKLPPPLVSPASLTEFAAKGVKIPRMMPMPPAAKPETAPAPEAAGKPPQVMAPELAVQVRQTGVTGGEAEKAVEKKKEDHPPAAGTSVDRESSEKSPQPEFKQFSGTDLDKIRMPKVGAEVADAPPATGKSTIRRIELETNREKKKKPKVVLPPEEQTVPVFTRVKSLKTVISQKIPKTVWLTLLGLFLLVSFAGIYFLTRETSVIGRVDLGDLQLVDQPAVVYNFSGKLDLLKSDYAKRIAPLNEQLKGIEDNLAAAKADVAARLQRKSMLEGQISSLETEIPKYIDASQSQLEALWSKQGVAMDKEYVETKAAMHREIEARAKQNGLKYERNKEIDALDVAVNSYKLALYAAPKSVKVDEERAFGEALLGRWKKFEDDWQTRQSLIKEKALEIKKQPGPKIEEAKGRIEVLRTDLASLNDELRSLQTEQDRYKQDKVELDAQVAAVTSQFGSDLMLLPKEFIKLKVSLESDTSVQMHNLQEKSLDMPPGNYIFFVRAKSGEEAYWAMKDFVIKEYERTQISITRQDFVPAQNFLK